MVLESRLPTSLHYRRSSLDSCVAEKKSSLLVAENKTTQVVGLNAAMMMLVPIHQESVISFASDQRAHVIFFAYPPTAAHHVRVVGKKKGGL